MASAMIFPPQSVYFNSHSNWGFHHPVQLTVGRGCRRILVDQLLNKTLLIVVTQRGRKQFTQDAILGELLMRNKVTWVDSVSENPGLTNLQVEIDRLRGKKFDAVIAFGGGSVIDAAKALNVALAPGCVGYSLQDLLAEPGLHANATPKPLYAVPTTSGTGSEVTPFATIWHHEYKKKLSLASSAVWPKAAFVDSALMDNLPMAATVSTGLDAINQAAESIWNRNANSITLSLATRALQLGFMALPKLVRGEKESFSRDQMAEASLLAGLAISHTRTALCHSISYPLTAYFGVPHGLACAFTMPSVLRHNLQAEDGRFSQVSQVLTGSTNLQSLVACFDWLHDTLLVRERVGAYIPDLGALLALKAEMFTPGRADNSLANISDLTKILKTAWG